MRPRPRCISARGIASRRFLRRRCGGAARPTTCTTTCTCPAYYDDLVTEYWALVNDVTLWDVGVERVVEISGPDGFALANMLTCRDLTRCAAGQGKYAPVIAPDGGIVNDPVLLRRDENTFWLCLADSDAHLYAMGLAHGRGLNATVSLPQAYPLQVQGPKAKDLMRDLVGEAIAGVKYDRTLDAAIAGIGGDQPHLVLDRRDRV